VGALGHHAPTFYQHDTVGHGDGRRAGKTTIIISHRPATIAVADRVVLVEGGRVVAEGTHEELAAGSPPYRKVLGLDEAIEWENEAGWCPA
jgi:ABC-type multidrug transport system ATPase subunit